MDMVIGKIETSTSELFILIGCIDSKLDRHPLFPVMEVQVNSYPSNLIAPFHPSFFYELRDISCYFSDFLHCLLVFPSIEKLDH